MGGLMEPQISQMFADWSACRGIPLERLRPRCRRKLTGQRDKIKGQMLRIVVGRQRGRSRSG